jgi:putative ABC transport system ATP-binding protein
MEAVLAQGLQKTYRQGRGQIHALRDVDLRLERGRVAALLGPSGSGKSTLIKALGLVTPADAGTIAFDGRTIFRDGKVLADVGLLRRRHLGMVFQKSNLISFLTARRNVELACELGGVASPGARARDLMAELGVLDRAEAYADELSGGEQQRIAIARALANSPSLLLADEPTAALDRDRGRAVMELFRSIARGHDAAVLVVTHDQRALDVFDDVYDMEDGRLSRRPA